MDKVWNDKLGYEMDVDLNEKVDKEVLKYQSGEIAKQLSEEEDEDKRFQVFDSSIMDAVMAAKDMYIEDKKSLKEVIDSLIEWLKKCQDKEEELMKTIDEEDEDESD